jgi:segregation and condensation protein A
MSVPDEYRVKLDVFEGPLDLLLYLIRKDEVDVYDIPVERITTQYMAYLDLMRMLDLNIAGEFIVMAATLMMIKSKMLLPVEERTADEDPEDEGDPRWDLVRQLVEYKKFKDAALHLQTLEERQEYVFFREDNGAVELGAKPDVALQDVSIFDLIAAFNDALSKVQKEELREIFAERFTVADKIDDLLQRLQGAERLSLTSLFSGMTSRHEIVCTFLAVLELMRLKRVRATQQQAYGPIELVNVGEEA